MVAGLEEISEGELYIGGRLVNDVALKTEILQWFSKTTLYILHMTVFENMAFGLKLRKTPKDEIKKRKLQKLQRFLTLSIFLTESRRLFQAVKDSVLLWDVQSFVILKVFLMDEPLSNLDAKLRVAMRTEIKKLHNKLQTTFMYVTHDQTEAMTMGTRIVVMKDGVIQQVDTPANLLYKA